MNMNETCYEKDWNSTMVESEFTINGKVLTIQQRRLSFGEVEEHQLNIKSAYKDPIVYKALLREEDIESKLEEAKKNLAKQIKKDTITYEKAKKELEKKIRKAKKDKVENIEEVFVEEISNVDLLKSKILTTEEEMEHALKDFIEIDEKTKYLLFESKMKLAENKKMVNTKFVAYSTSPTTLYGGYFKIDGKQLSLNDTCVVLRELDTEIFEDLFVNANNLAYPSKEESEQVK